MSGTQALAQLDSFASPGRASRVSAATTAGLLVAAVVFVNEAVFRISDAETLAFDWMIALRLVVCAACGLFGVVHFSQTKGDFNRFPGALCVLFAAWSVATVPFAVNVPYAASACIAFWCLVLFVPAALSLLSARALVAAVLAGVGAYIVGSWIAYFAVPELGRMTEFLPEGESMSRFGGLNHPNGTGRIASLAIVLLAIVGLERVARWRTIALPLVLAAATLYATRSRTPLLACVAALVALSWPRINRTFLAAVCFGVVPLLGATLIALLLVDPINLRLDDLFAPVAKSGEAEEIYTLTGRTEIWRFAVDRIREAPLLGYGHGSARFVMSQFADLPAHHAHNLVLNVTLTTGIIGGGLLIAILLAQVSQALLHPQSFPDAITAIVVVGGLADNVMLGPIPDALTLLWLMAVYWRQMGKSFTEDARNGATTEATV